MRPWTIFAGSVTVLLLLTETSRAWGFSKLLILELAVSFLLCVALAWLLSPSGKPSRLLCFSLALWLAANSILLLSLHRLDRGGWIWLKLTGKERITNQDLSPLAALPLDELVSRHPFLALKPGEPSGLVLRRGDHTINQTVIIPRGTSLNIEPGATLRFAAGRSLISYSPITARGTEHEPILFTARNRWLKWGAVGVVRAGKSHFQHVKVEHSRFAVINNIDFPGSLSLIETEAEIIDCTFSNLYGRDALYALRSGVVIRNSLFRDIEKDGVDFDGGTGQISHSLFVNCRDEAVDLSLNHDIRVYANTILDSRGGRVAADYGLEAIRAKNTLGYFEEPSR